jgi:hypothetical protein
MALILILFVLKSQHSHKFKLVRLASRLLGGGGPIGPPLFERHVAQQVLKSKKVLKISYSIEII